jgi:exodeoxyribonuclease VII large subunit
MVADLRAPTPSAAAELAVPDHLVLKENLSDMIIRGYNVFIHRTDIHQRSVSDITQRLISSMPGLNLLRRQIDDQSKTLETTLVGNTDFTQIELLSLQQRLQTLNPTATLQRGYAVVQKSETGHVLSTTKEVAVGERLNITLVDGTLQVTNSVLKTPNNKKPSVLSRKHPEMKPLI